MEFNKIKDFQNNVCVNCNKTYSRFTTYFCNTLYFCSKLCKSSWVCRDIDNRKEYLNFYTFAHLKRRLFKYANYK
jgi:hypothetical protein